MHQTSTPRHFTDTSQFRSSRSGRQFGENTNRTRTGQIDHDVFEGLPVRRWTRQAHIISQAPKPDESESIFQGPGGRQTLPEHPMPRDSQLLTPTSKALLRAARAGCIYIRQTTKEPEDEEKETLDPDEQPASSSGASAPKAERSFVARKWSTVPRHMEPPEIEFLAKRRPGLPSLYGVSAITADGVPSPPMRRTRFTRVDPTTGNVSIYEAWVPEGWRIEGEIAPDAQVVPENPEATVAPETPASGTVIEGVGTVNDEGVVVAEPGSAAVFIPKRRPPPPKRKGKGFKGRRKKVMFAPGEGGDASAVHGAGPGAGDAKDGVKEEDGDASRGDQAGQEEEEEDGEEGEESDEGDESMVEAKTPETPLTQANTESATDSAAEPSAAQQAVPALDTAVDSKPHEASQAPVPDQPSHEQQATEDMPMADAQPSEPPTEVKFESQPPPESPNPAPEAQPVPETTEKEAPQPAEQSIATEDSTEKPSETIKTEEKEADQDAMDTSEDQPAEPAPAPEQTPKQETPAENDQNGGSLETSQGGPAGDAQAETQPEQTSGVSIDENPAEPAPEQVREEQQSTEQVGEQPADQPADQPSQAEGQAPEPTVESAQQPAEQQQAPEQPTTAPTTEVAPEPTTTEQTAGQTAEQPQGQEEQPKEEKTEDQTETQQQQQQQQQQPAPAPETADPSPSAPAQTSTFVPTPAPEPEPTNEPPTQTEESQPKPAEASDSATNASANPENPTKEEGKKEGNDAEITQ